MELARPIVWYDTETTGVHPDVDRIIQIGVVKVYPDGKMTEYEMLVNPGIPIPCEATKIHGITDDDVKDAPRFRSQEIYGALFMGMKDCDLGGYNVKFDLRMTVAECKRNNLLTPEWGQIIDPNRIYHKMMRRNLTAAAKEFLNEVYLDAHGALPDARMAMRVLEGQLERWPELPRSVPELATWIDTPEGDTVDPEGKLALRHGQVVINFGNKALGQRLDQCDTSYLKWILRNDFNAVVRKHVSDELNRRLNRS